MALGDNPDINYVPPTTRRVSVPAMTEMEQSQKYAQDLENRERIARGVSDEHEALQQRRYNEEMRRVAIASRRRRTAAAQAAIDARDPAAQAAGQVAAGERQFNQAFDAMGRRVVSTSPRPGHAQTKRFTDTMIGPDGRSGLVQEAAPLQRNVDAAETNRQMIAAEALEDVADRQLAAMTQLRANQQAQAQREAAQIDRIRHVNDLATKAITRFDEVKDVDPGRYWRSQPAFFKFIAAIAAGLKGWAGRTDATAHITDAIAMDIDAQKAAIAKASANVGNLQSQAAREESVYGQILAQTSSEREADLTYTKALLQHAQFEMAARLERAGVSVLNAHQQRTFNSLQQQIASVEMQLGKVAAANTETVTTVRSPYTSGQQRALGKLADAGVANMTEGRKALIGTMGAREEQASKERIAGATHGPDSLEERKFQRDMRKDLAGGEKGAAVETALKLSQEYLADYAEDVPGRTEGGISGDAWAREPSWWQSDAGKRESKRRDLISQWYATALTGANVSDRQEEFLDRLARDPDMSGDEIRAGVQDLQESLLAYQATTQRIAEPQAEADYRGVSVDQMPARDQKLGGRQRSNTGVDAEVEALGGRLR
jgi:hypothetical protein